MAFEKIKAEDAPRARFYSDEDKAGALALLDVNGGNYNKTGNMLGIYHQTICKWDKARKEDAALEVRTGKKRETLADRLDDIIEMMVGGMNNQSKINAASLSVLAIATGTLIDKSRLLRGESTNNEDAHIRIIVEYGDPTPRQD